MAQYLKDLVKIDNQDDLYEEIEIERVRLFRARNLLELHLHTPNVLSFESYQEIHHKLKNLTGSNIQLCAFLKVVLYSTMRKSALSNMRLLVRLIATVQVVILNM